MLENKRLKMSGEQTIVRFFKIYKNAVETGNYESFFINPVVKETMQRLEHKLMTEQRFHYQQPEKPEYHK